MTNEIIGLDVLTAKREENKEQALTTYTFEVPVLEVIQCNALGTVQASSKEEAEELIRQKTLQLTEDFCNIESLGLLVVGEVELGEEN